MWVYNLTHFKINLPVQKCLHIPLELVTHGHIPGCW